MWSQMPMLLRKLMVMGGTHFEGFSGFTQVLAPAAASISRALPHQQQHLQQQQQQVKRRVTETTMPPI